MTPSSTDVVIVGAGPTGLMLACQLSLYPNVSFRIVDKNVGATNQSRALAVHARSLELFAQLGLVEKAIAQGTVVQGMNIHLNGQLGLRLDFTSLDREKHILLTEYPHMLFLEQSATEQLLENYLIEHGIEVERDKEVRQIEDIDKETVQVTLGNGEVLRTKYVCACDGAHSIVRHQLQLSFDGRTYPSSLFLADCQVDNCSMPRNEANAFYTTHGLAAMFPMKNGRYRVVGTIEEQDSKVTFDNVVQLFKERTAPLDLLAHDCGWVSMYRSHHRQATHFRYRSRYFLLGDAAHIHSPLGGQGMNTGLQDAHNLAWKLGFVLTHDGKDRLLDTYHDERHLVAKKLVRSTDRAFYYASTPTWYLRLSIGYIIPPILRWIVQPLFNRYHYFRRAFFLLLSQLAISYRLPNIYDYGASAGEFPSNIPQPGDRFPYFLFNARSYHLVLFENRNLTEVRAFLQSIQKTYSTMIDIHYADKEKISLPYPGAFLVRPDGFIAYRTVLFDLSHFHSYFAQYFPHSSI